MQQDGFHDVSDDPLSCISISYDSSHLIVLTYNFKNGSVFYEYLYNDDCTYYYFVPFNSSFFVIASYGHLIEFQAGSNFNYPSYFDVSLDLLYHPKPDWPESDFVGRNDQSVLIGANNLNSIET